MTNNNEECTKLYKLPLKKFHSHSESHSVHGEVKLILTDLVRFPSVTVTVAKQKSREQSAGSVDRESHFHSGSRVKGRKKLLV